MVPRGLGRPRGSGIRRDAAPPTDADSPSAPRPQSRSAGVPPRAAAPSHDPITPRTRLGAPLHADSTPADGVGWPRAGCGPSQHALDTQDRPLTRPRTPSLACPGLLQWPPIRHIATKMAALSSLPCPPCVHTSKVLCAVCPSEGCRRCLKLKRCVARIFNFTVSGPILEASAHLKPYPPNPRLLAEILPQITKGMENRS